MSLKLCPCCSSCSCVKRCCKGEAKVLNPLMSPPIDNGTEKIPVRFMIGVMMGLACIASNMVRGNMSLSILSMTKPIYNTTADVPDYGPRYEWSAYDQSLVLGSYFWGHVVIISFAGIFSERYGPRKIVAFVVTIAALLTVLTPVAANFLWLIIILRFFTGLAMGTVSPALQAIVANWAPPEEKGKFLSVYLASGIGTVIDWCMSGFVIKHLGWKFAFYIVVVILAIYVAAWLFIFYDSPTKHPYISDSEKEFILSKLTTTKSEKKHWPPIMSILSSIPFWALVCFHFGNSYATYLFLTAAPKYLSEVHHFDIASTGVFSSVPSVVRFIFGIIFGFVGDYLFKSKIMSPNTIRKSFSTFSHLIPACFLIGILFVGHQPYVCITFISLALGFSGAITITAMQNPHDLSPNFATTIYGFIHTIGSTPGFIAPLVVAHFTKERSSEEEWRNIFLVGAGLYIGSALIFIIFGSGYVQKWNDIMEDANNEIPMQSDVLVPANSKIESKRN